VLTEARDGEVFVADGISALEEGNSRMVISATDGMMDESIYVQSGCIQPASWIMSQAAASRGMVRIPQAREVEYILLNIEVLGGAVRLRR
jgi:hypothetical protein